jgi:AraC family transcriptional regulator
MKKPAYDWLYGQWLPQSGRLPADAPCVEEYLNNPRTTAPTELLSDIYLPLREITA